MMSKLIVSMASMGPGGAERVLSALSKHLADNFNEVQYVMWEGKEVFYNIDSRIKIISLPMLSGQKGRVCKILAFRRLIKCEHPDLILSFLTPFNILVLISTLGLKQNIVVAERTDPRRLLTGGKLILRFRDFLYRKCRGILTQTEYAKSCYKGILNKKTAVIYNPVTINKYQVGNALQTKKEHLMITAGRLEPVKNHVMMIDAFRLFHKDHPDYRLVIYGEGMMKEYLTKYIFNWELQDIVILAGRTDQLWEKMLRAECFLLTSNYEGMSNALIEAMCLGLPVISTKVAGSTDLIRNGLNGFLIDVKNTDALVECMNRLANDEILRQRIGMEACKVYELLRDDKICQQWIDYLKAKLT